MKKALIINEGYSDNLGDQAINKAVHALLHDLGFKTSFLHFSKPSLTPLPAYNYRKPKDSCARKSKLSQLKGLVYIWYWLKKNKKAVLKELNNKPIQSVVFGGGQLLNSSGTIAPSGFAISLYWISRLVKKNTDAKIYLIGIGSSGNFGRLERYLYRKAIQNVTDIWVRDQYSREVFKNFFKREASVIPDVAFYSSSEVNTAKNNKDNLALFGITSYNEVFLKYYQGQDFSREKYFEQLFEEIQSYTAKNISVKLFYTTLTDAVECQHFSNYIANKYNVKLEICDISNLSDLMELFKNSSYVYTARMHGLILGMKAGCDVKANLISQKLRSFNSEYILGSEKCGALSNSIINELQNKL